MNAKYEDWELDYLDDKLAEWVRDPNDLDFVQWMLAGNDSLGVLHHLKETDG